MSDTGGGDDVSVRDVPEESAYVVELDGVRVGAAYYTPNPTRIVFTHTEVDPSVGGRGIGSALARGALDDVVARGLEITPVCPFITEYVRRHPAYVEHVDAAHRGAVTPPPG